MTDFKQRFRSKLAVRLTTAHLQCHFGKQWEFACLLWKKNRKHSLVTRSVSSNSRSNNWLVTVVDSVARKYLEEALQLLDSVNKMEESLKRLKRAREQKAATGNQTTSTATGLCHLSSNISISFLQTFPLLRKRLANEKTRKIGI